MTQIVATWSGGGRGPFNWNTPTDWSGGGVPDGSNFNAFLTRGGVAYTVVVSGPEEVGLLATCAHATLRESSGGASFDPCLIPPAARSC